MYLGIDIGGSKTLIGLFSSGGKIKKVSRFKTPSDYEDFLKHLSDTLKTFEIKDVKTVCAAVPGKIDRRAGTSIAFGNLEWGVKPIRADIRKITSKPTIIENDANLAGLYEASKLSDDNKKVLYLTISTGIGSGFITNGIIDPDFADAEVGQILLEHEGRLKRWEEFASGKAISKMYGKKASEITDKAAWYLIARNIAIGMVDLVTTLTPDVIIIGGGVGSNLYKFEDRLIEEMKIFSNELIALPVIKMASEPEKAVLLGCYKFAKENKQ